MNFSKYKEKKYMDIILPAAIALFLVIVLSYIFIKFIDNASFLVTGISNIYSIISPFIYGIIFAYILNPIMNIFEKKFKLKRGISILCTYMIIVGILLIVMIYLMPKVTANIIDIVKNIPYFTSLTEEWVNRFMSNIKLQNVVNSYQISALKPDELISKVSTLFMTWLNSFLTNIISFTNYFIRWIFGFLIAIYILFDKEKLICVSRKVIYKVFKQKYGDRLITLIENLNKMIGTYIGIKAIDSLIIAIIAIIGLVILKSPYAILIAVVVGITNMIPYFGPFIGMVVAVLINIFFSPIRAIIVLAFLFLLQQFDGWYLDPKLIGNKVGLSPILVMFAVTLGGGLYGVVGMVLSVPIAGVIKIYLDKLSSVKK